MATQKKSSTGRTYMLRDAHGEQIVVNADEAQMESNGARVIFYRGDAVVGSFTGFSSFYEVTDAPVTDSE